MKNNLINKLYKIFNKFDKNRKQLDIIYHYFIYEFKIYSLLYPENNKESIVRYKIWGILFNNAYINFNIMWNDFIKEYQELDENNYITCCKLYVKLYLIIDNYNKISNLYIKKDTIFKKRFYK